MSIQDEIEEVGNQVMDLLTESDYQYVLRDDPLTARYLRQEHLGVRPDLESYNIGLAFATNVILIGMGHLWGMDKVKEYLDYATEE